MYLAQENASKVNSTPPLLVFHITEQYQRAHTVFTSDEMKPEGVFLIQTSFQPVGPKIGEN